MVVVAQPVGATAVIREAGTARVLDSMMNVWEPQLSESGKTVHWRLGPLDLWVKQVGEEWHVAAVRAEEGRSALLDDVEPEADVDWRRWAAEVASPRLKVTPVLPDRSVIVRPGTPLQILPGHEARFFVGIPVWIQLSIADGEDKELQICEEPTVQLSKSWFGTPTEGELCYALRTRAKRTLDELTPLAYRTVSPLLLRNESDSTLDFQRLCLRARHLNIYRGAKHIWTNEGTVTFKGEEALTHVMYGEGAPPFDQAGEQLGEARDRPGKGFVSRTFSNLRAFAAF